MPTSTCGGPSCQSQKTDTRSAPRLNSTRIQVSVFHTCIDQPVPGVAETRVASADASAKTTWPPSVSYALTRPDADAEGEGECDGRWLGGADVREVGEGAGEPLCDGGGGGGGDEGAPERCADTSAAVMGRARGGSYAVPVITVWTPHHDSVTAAPVASSQAST